MEKFAYIFIVLLGVMFVLLAFYFIFRPMVRQQKMLNGVVNYDPFMRKFVFRIDGTKDLFGSELNMHNVNDTLEYSLSNDRTVITFLMYHGKFEYEMLIDEFDGFIILRLQQLCLSGRVSFHINEFMIRKFQAKPLEWTNYHF